MSTWIRCYVNIIRQSGPIGTRTREWMFFTRILCKEIVIILQFLVIKESSKLNQQKVIENINLPSVFVKVIIVSKSTPSNVPNLLTNSESFIGYTATWSPKTIRDWIIIRKIL